MIKKFSLQEYLDTLVLSKHYDEVAEKHNMSIWQKMAFAAQVNYDWYDILWLINYFCRTPSSIPTIVLTDKQVFRVDFDGRIIDVTLKLWVIPRPDSEAKKWIYYIEDHNAICMLIDRDCFFYK